MIRLDVLIRDRFELIGVVVTFVIAVTCLANFTNFSYAQTSASATPVRDFVKSGNNDPSVSHVLVIYESPQTVILELQEEPPSYFEELGHAIDFAKQQGFSIDSTSVFNEPQYDLRIYNVFMSKK